MTGRFDDMLGDSFAKAVRQYRDRNAFREPADPQPAVMTPGDLAKLRRVADVDGADAREKFETWWAGALADGSWVLLNAPLDTGGRVALAPGTPNRAQRRAGARRRR